MCKSINLTKANLRLKCKITKHSQHIQKINLSLNTNLEIAFAYFFIRVDLILELNYFLFLGDNLKSTCGYKGVPSVGSSLLLLSLPHTQHLHGVTKMRAGTHTTDPTAHAMFCFRENYT